jgi:hypothetical protein
VGILGRDNVYYTLCFTFYVLFNQSKNFLNRSHVLEWIHHFGVEV